jgi:tetratricopeptide (TPR) repeat protein
MYLKGEYRLLHPQHAVRSLVVILFFSLIVSLPVLAYSPEDALFVPWSWQRSPADPVYRHMKLWDVEDNALAEGCSFSPLLILKEYSSPLRDIHDRQKALNYLTKYYEKIDCPEEALFHYRRLLNEFPDSEAVPLWIEAIMELYSHLGNSSAIIDLYNRISPEKKHLLTDHAIYLVGQTHYLKSHYN